MDIFASAESGGTSVSPAAADSASANTPLPDGVGPYPTAFVPPAAAAPAGRVGHQLPGTAGGHDTGRGPQVGESVRTLAMRLGFAGLFVVSAVVLMALGYEAAAIVQVMLGAGWAASTALRGLR